MTGMNGLNSQSTRIALKFRSKMALGAVFLLAVGLSAPAARADLLGDRGGISLGRDGLSVGASFGGISAGASLGGDSVASAGASVGGASGVNAGATVGGDSVADVDVGIGGASGLGAGVNAGGGSLAGVSVGIGGTTGGGGTIGGGVTGGGVTGGGAAGGSSTGNRDTTAMAGLLSDNDLRLGITALPATTRMRCAQGATSRVLNGLPIVDRSNALMGWVHGARFDQRQRVSEISIQSTAKRCMMLIGGTYKVAGGKVSVNMDAARLR